MNQELVKAQLLAIRNQVEAALIVLEMNESIEKPISRMTCPHPPESRTDVTLMGDGFRMFYCRVCGVTVQTTEIVGT